MAALPGGPVAVRSGSGAVVSQHAGGGQRLGFLPNSTTEVGGRSGLPPLFTSTWRRGWDSNPRTTCAVTRSPGAPDRPLQHLSAFIGGHAPMRRHGGLKASATRGVSRHVRLRRRSMAEGVGFEPTVRLRAHRFSRAAPSTTRTPLHSHYSAGCILAGWAGRTAWACRRSARGAPPAPPGGGCTGGRRS